MKLSREYITKRLQDTSVEDLAKEIAESTAEQYRGIHDINMEATVKKFERMLRPLAPRKTGIKATDFMRSQGVEVTEL